MIAPTEAFRGFRVAVIRLATFVALIALPGSGIAEPLKTLRIVTINVWSGLDYRGHFRMGEYEEAAIRKRRNEILINQLRELAPDIVALNEANKLPQYARKMAQELGCNKVWHVGVGGLRAGPVGLPVNLREGDAILARPELELRRAGRRQLSGGPVGNFIAAHFSDATQVVAARIRVGLRMSHVIAASITFLCAGPNSLSIAPKLSWIIQSTGFTPRIILECWPKSPCNNLAARRDESGGLEHSVQLLDQWHRLD